MANFPLSVTTFVTKNAGDTIQPADVNDLQNEVNAIEAGYLNGTARLNSSNSTVNTLSVTGGQITFPATQASSTNRNTLDDYEEGQWVPVIGGSGGTSGQTYSIQQGQYLKVGKLTVAFFSVTLSVKGTITGTVEIQGLPFTVDNSVISFYGSQSLLWAALNSTYVNLSVVAVAATTKAAVTGITVAATANNASIGVADISNTTTLQGAVIYMAAA